MQLTRFDQTEQFYTRAEPFLLAREANHNLLLGICADLMRHPEQVRQPPYLAVVEQDERVVAAAVMTPPRNLIVAHVLAPGALALLAEDLAGAYQSLPGVAGPAPTSRLFAEQWRIRGGQEYRLGMAMRIYQLTAVQAVTGVAGRPRRATAADRDLLIDWFGGFGREALGSSSPDEVAQNVDRWLSSELRGIYLWEDGRPVAMAGYAGPTPHGIRVAAVYTPPQQRRRGYASACVAALSQDLLDSGRRFCFLFTDLGNPTSNHIYQEVGYVPVCDMDEYRFVASER